MILNVIITGIYLLNFFQIQTVNCNNVYDYITKSDINNLFQESKFSGSSDYDIIYLDTNLERNKPYSSLSDSTVSPNFPYSFNAFGRNFQLNLKPNHNLVSPNFKAYKNGIFGKMEIDEPIVHCHYLHHGQETTAALSFCQQNAVDGFILWQNATLEIKPLTENLKSVVKFREAFSENISEENLSDQVPHIVKRAYNNIPSDDYFPGLNFGDFDTDSNRVVITPGNDQNKLSFNKRGSYEKLTIEIAVFLDAAAYKLFAPYMNHSDKRMRDMLLAYMNGVQALYHHPSLGTTIDIVIVRMDLMATQPANMPHYDGERGKLLDSFCEYQEKLNPSSDADPHHWDMALYVSGLDFYAIENGKKSGVTMGLATVGGVCLAKYACVIAELGTTNVFGKPYPSAGFTSVYIAAHEIGHNLGMHHDSSGNNCPKDGYIMSPSRGTNGETRWSSCSADVVRKLSWAKCLYDSAKKPSKDLDHSRFLDAPGQKYNAKKQCEILLRDKDANILPSQELSSICYNLQCKTPHRSGYYFAGPALEGTYCGSGKWCVGGECVKSTKPKPPTVVHGGWSAWNVTHCKSGCLQKSLGYQERRRTCTNPAPVNSDVGCEGASYDVQLCKDAKICKTRKKVTDYAAEKCKFFSKRLPELDPQSSGLQAPHETARPWMGCAIFCRRKDTGTYYTPRVELNDLGISPYFPDGTWCHNDGSSDYFCVQHHCLPENFQLTKNVWIGIGEDIPIPQNAHPHGYLLPPSLLSYLSLGPDGKPLQTVLKSGDSQFSKEQDWEIDDYIELPHHTTNEILPNIDEYTEV